MYDDSCTCASLGLATHIHGPTHKWRGFTISYLEEREEISRGLGAGRSIREIAQELSRSPSTISREINRNGTMRRYRAASADPAAFCTSETVQTGNDGPSASAGDREIETGLISGANIRMADTCLSGE
jgi:DNA-binding CsgD family transcriptional regulator